MGGQFDLFGFHVPGAAHLPVSLIGFFRQLFPRVTPGGFLKEMLMTKHAAPPEPPEEAPDQTPPKPPEPPEDDEDPDTPLEALHWREGDRSMLDHRAHPLHHLKDA